MSVKLQGHVACTVEYIQSTVGIKRNDLSRHRPLPNM